MTIVSFIGGGKRSTRRKPPTYDSYCTSLVVSKPPTYDSYCTSLVVSKPPTYDSYCTSLVVSKPPTYDSYCTSYCTSLVVSKPPTYDSYCTSYCTSLVVSLPRGHKQEVTCVYVAHVQCPRERNMSLYSVRNYLRTYRLLGMALSGERW